MQPLVCQPSVDGLNTPHHRSSESSLACDNHPRSPAPAEGRPLIVPTQLIEQDILRHHLENNVHQILLG